MTKQIPRNPVVSQSQNLDHVIPSIPVIILFPVI